MLTRYPNKNAKILVAVALDDMSPQLLENAKCLSAKTGMGIHVVHVAPFLPPISLEYYPSEPIRQNVIEELEAQTIAEAEKKLQKLIAPFNVPMTYRVYSSQLGIIGPILSAATTENAAAILCGCGERIPRLVPKGFSTVLSLLAEGNAPLIVVGPGMNILPDREQCRILLADDLRSETLPSMTGGIFWAQVLGASVRHLHVMSPEIFKADGCLQKLQERVAWEKALLLEKGGSYESKVAEADVLEGIKDEAQSFEPNIIVFGQHKTFHRRPLGLGQTSYKAMLNLNYPIMVVPA